MFKKKKKGIFGQRFPQILFLIFILTALSFLIFSNWKIFQKREELKREIQALTEKIKILEEKKAELKEKITQTQSQDYWEEKIRKEGYIKEGENPVLILAPEELKKGEISQSQKKENFFEKLKKFFRD